MNPTQRNNFPKRGTRHHPLAAFGRLFGAFTFFQRFLVGVHHCLSDVRVAQIEVGPHPLVGFFGSLQASGRIYVLIEELLLPEFLFLRPEIAHLADAVATLQEKGDGDGAELFQIVLLLVDLLHEAFGSFRRPERGARRPGCRRRLDHGCNALHDRDEIEVSICLLDVEALTFAGIEGYVYMIERTRAHLRRFAFVRTLEPVRDAKSYVTGAAVRFLPVVLQHAIDMAGDGFGGDITCERASETCTAL